MDIGIIYETPPEKVKRATELLEEVYRSHPKTKDVLIGFNKFNDFSLNIMVVHWWNSVDYKEYLAGMQELNLEIMKRFKEEGIEFAYPTQLHYVKKVD
jgi:MscS family membrane protein